MARNSSQKKEGMLSRMISVVSGGEEKTEERARDESPEGGESATTMLKAQHDEVRQLFKEFDDASENARSSRKRIVDETCQKLKMHSQLEEKIFYPACRQLQDEDARKMVAESYEEHAIVDRLVLEMGGVEPSDERFEAKFTVLKENVEHHADEEERDLFPAAEKEMGDEQLEQIGQQMAQMMRRLMSGEAGGGGQRGSRGGSSRSGSESSGSSSSSGRSSGSRDGQARGRSSTRGQSGGSQGSRSGSSSSRSRSGSSGSSGRSKRSSGSSRSSSSSGRRSQSKKR